MILCFEQHVLFFFPFSGQDDAKFKRKLKIGKSRYTDKTIPRDPPTEGKGDYFARSKREKKKYSDGERDISIRTSDLRPWINYLP